MLLNNNYKLILVIYLFILFLLLFNNIIVSDNLLATFSTLFYFSVILFIILYYIKVSNLFNPIFAFCLLQITVYFLNWYSFTYDINFTNDTYVYLKQENIDFYIFKYNLLHSFYLFSSFIIFELLRLFPIKKITFCTLDNNLLVRISYFFVVVSLFSVFMFYLNFESIFEMLIQRELSRGDRVASEAGRHWALLSQMILLSVVLLIFSNKYFLKSKAFWFIFFLNLIIIYLVSGNRTSLALSFLLIIFGQFYHFRKVLNLKTSLILVLCFIILNFANILREDGVSYFERSEHASSDNNDFDFISKFVNMRAERAINGNAAIGVLSYLEYNDLILGESYSSIPYIFILSNLTESGKPPAAGKLAAELLADRKNTAWPIGSVIESYFNFSYLGVLFNSIIYGVICYFIYNLISNNPNNPIVISIYFSFILFFSLGSDGLYKSLPLILPLFSILILSNFKVFR